MAAPLTFEEMVAALHDLLDGDCADIDEVTAVMSRYKSNPRDWSKYAFLDPCKYTRNLVDEGNGKFNLMLLAWDCGQASSIHDHAGAHCFMKVLGGTAEQELYAPPSEIEEGKEMVPTSVTQHKKDEILYISDQIGLHRIANPSHSEPLYTLHLYSPPYASCRTFDARCGQARSSGRMTFYSRQGKVMSPLER